MTAACVGCYAGAIVLGFLLAAAQRMGPPRPRRDRSRALPRVHRTAVPARAPRPRRAGHRTGLRTDHDAGRILRLRPAVERPRLVCLAAGRDLDRARALREPDPRPRRRRRRRQAHADRPVDSTPGRDRLRRLDGHRLRADRGGPGPRHHTVVDARRPRHRTDGAIHLSRHPARTTSTRTRSCRRCRRTSACTSSRACSSSPATWSRRSSERASEADGATATVARRSTRWGRPAPTDRPRRARARSARVRCGRQPAPAPRPSSGPTRRGGSWSSRSHAPPRGRARVSSPRTPGRC